MAGHTLSLASNRRQRRLAGIDTSTPAVVLKFDPNVMHHGGLGAIRSLGRLGVPVYGVVEGAWAPAARSRYLAGRDDLLPFGLMCVRMAARAAGRPFARARHRRAAAARRQPEPAVPLAR